MCCLIGLEQYGQSNGLDSQKSKASASFYAYVIWLKAAAFESTLLMQAFSSVWRWCQFVLHSAVWDCMAYHKAS